MLDLMGHRTLPELLRDRAETDPDRVWLVCEDAAGAVTRLTYGHFHHAVLCLAAGLRSLGIGVEDKVALLLDNGADFVLTFFALAHLGAVAVPCITRNHPDEIADVLTRSDARLLVTEPAHERTAGAVVERVGGIRLVGTAAMPGAETTFGALLGYPPLTTPSPATDESVVEILFTSGTTAAPKGVLITHANCVFAGEMVARSYLLAPGERCLTALPLYHLNALALSLMAALTVGGTLITLREYRASKFWSQVRAHEATQVSLVGMVVRTLLAQPAAATDRDHRVRRSSFALNVTDDERDEFEQRFDVELINGYGLSEAVAGVTVAPMVGPRRWPSIGLPAMQRAVRLVDESGQDVPPGSVGEIWVHGVPGRTLALGYYQDPQATAAAFGDGWLRTGDLATADELGFLYFVDRRKDIVKRAGENISTSEVETVLGRHPAVARAAVFGVPDPIRDQAVVAVVEPVAPGAVAVPELLEFCRVRMAAYKVPSIINLCEQLPVTSVGKIDKKALRAGFGTLGSQVEEQR